MTVDPETQAVVDEALAALTAFMDAELAGRPAPERDRLGRHAAQQLGAAHDADWLLMADTLTNAAADKIRALHPGPGWGALPIACTRDGTRINPPEHSPLTWAVRAVTARINDDAGYIDHLRLPAGDDQVEQLLTTLCSIYGQIYATAIRAGGGGRVSTCRSCGADVVWVKTEAGNLMPIDATPAEGGNVLLTGATAETMNGGRVPVARVEAEAPLFDDGSPRHLSHFATCPDADSWKRRS